MFLHSPVSYASMLFKYFGHDRSHDQSIKHLADMSRIANVMENIKTLKDKWIYPKRSHLNKKEHIFDAIQSESTGIERLLEDCLTDLRLIEDSLANQSQMPEHLVSIYRSVSEDQFPYSWKHGNGDGKPWMTLSSFLALIEKKFDYFEEILGQPQDSILPVNICVFTRPSLFLDACKLEYIQGCEGALKDEWIAEVIFVCFYSYFQIYNDAFIFLDTSLLKLRLCSIGWDFALKNKWVYYCFKQ